MKKEEAYQKFLKAKEDLIQVLVDEGLCVGDIVDFMEDYRDE